MRAAPIRISGSGLGLETVREQLVGLILERANVDSAADDAEKIGSALVEIERLSGKHRKRSAACGEGSTARQQGVRFVQEVAPLAVRLRREARPS